MRSVHRECFLSCLREQAAADKTAVVATRAAELRSALATRRLETNSKVGLRRADVLAKGVGRNAVSSGRMNTSRGFPCGVPLGTAPTVRDLRVEELPKLLQCPQVNQRLSLCLHLSARHGVQHPTRDGNSESLRLPLDLNADDRARLFLPSQPPEDLHLVAKERVERIADATATELMSSVGIR